MCLAAEKIEEKEIELDIGVSVVWFPGRAKQPPHDLAFNNKNRQMSGFNFFFSVRLGTVGR